MKVVELFSGIGSQAKAIKKIDRLYENSATCEWDIHAIVGYDLIHNDISENHFANYTYDQIIEFLQNYTLSRDGKTPLLPQKLNAFSMDAVIAIANAIKRSKNLVNVKDLRGVQLENDIDVLTYSFPCQDLSNVGALHGYKGGIDRDANNRSWRGVYFGKRGKCTA